MGGRVVGRKPKAMSLKKTLNSRGERTVEPAIISWQWFIFPSLPPLEPSWKILISPSEQRYGYYSVRSLLLHLLMTPTRLQRLERLSQSDVNNHALPPQAAPPAPPSPALAVCHRLRRGWMVVVM